ncbi:hypothetical protein XENORESO_021912, partial [Xenotaenia resolanae]
PVSQSGDSSSAAGRLHSHRYSPLTLALSLLTRSVRGGDQQTLCLSAYVIDGWCLHTPTGRPTCLA